jgi:hypothetical protein
MKSMQLIGDGVIYLLKYQIRVTECDKLIIVGRQVIIERKIEFRVGAALSRDINPSLAA